MRPIHIDREQREPDSPPRPISRRRALAATTAGLAMGVIAKPWPTLARVSVRETDERERDLARLRAALANRTPNELTLLLVMARALVAGDDEGAALACEMLYAESGGTPPPGLLGRMCPGYAARVTP